MTSVRNSFTIVMVSAAFIVLAIPVYAMLYRHDDPWSQTAAFHYEYAAWLWFGLVFASTFAMTLVVWRRRRYRIRAEPRPRAGTEESRRTDEGPADGK